MFFKKNGSKNRCNIFFLLVSITTFLSFSSKKTSSIEKALSNIRNDLPFLSLKERKFSEYEHEYFSYYKIDFSDCTHSFGKISVNGYSVAVHIFQPVNAEATMILVHGYYDHTGVLQGLIKHYLDMNYNVIVYDHPGHGLSSGEQNSINDFSDYTSVLAEIIKFTEKNLKAPYSITAHSMGCPITIDFIKTNREKNFRDIIFIAPLFHIAKWEVIVKVNNLNSGIIDASPRILRNNTKNRKFKKFVANDPLQSRVLSSKWVIALIRWNERIEKTPQLENRITVIQGTGDTTVDWKYNMEKIVRYVPNSEIYYIKKAGHQLMNEIEKYRSQMIEIIDQKISD